jgi:hypothetical protein
MEIMPIFCNDGGWYASYEAIPATIVNATILKSGEN